jgi:hypothetical protein
MLRDSLSTAILATLFMACSADPPLRTDAQAADLGLGRFASLARCSPDPGAAEPACPGASCIDNARGAPDGKLVGLDLCPTIDLIFTGGTLVAQAPRDSGPPLFDLRLHLGSSSGLTRVEASFDGKLYLVVGFIAAKASDLPAGTEASCAAALAGGTASLSLSRCNSISNATFLRLSRDDQVPGSATLDAAEAISFAAAGR